MSNPLSVLFPPEPIMGVQLPVPLQDPGPQYAADNNSAFTQIIGHTHIPGYGVPITPAAMNINAAILMNQNQLTNAGSANFAPQTGTLSGINLLYSNAGNLYWNNGSGTPIQITPINASSNGIAGLPSTPAGAAVTYSGGDAGTYTFTTTSGGAYGTIIGQSVIVNAAAADSNGITIASPNALGSAYTITLLTALPGATKLLTISSSGQLASSTINGPASLPSVTSNISLGTSGVLTASANIYNQDGTADLMPAAYPASFVSAMAMGTNGNITVAQPSPITTWTIDTGNFTSIDAKFWRGVDGVVHMQGWVEQNSISANPALIATLPSGYGLIPAVSQSFYRTVPQQTPSDTQWDLIIIGTGSGAVDPSGSTPGQIYAALYPGAVFLAALAAYIFDGVSYLGVT